MARAGFDRTLEQINNKLKKLKKGYRDHKRDPGRSAKGGPKHSPHYEVLDSVLGDRPQSGTVNSITLETMVEDRLNLQSSTDTELSGSEEAASELPPASACSSPKPQSRSSPLPTGSSPLPTASSPLPTASSPLPTGSSPQEPLLPSGRHKQVKRKRDLSSELLLLMKKSDERGERFLEHSQMLVQQGQEVAEGFKQMSQVMKEIREDNCCMLGLMCQMVAAMEDKHKD
ncbi:hypothetical protein NQZ68_031145 [Dissostichus eleginoides]|nr:hypothetical protein NQZ68_031145 [Dissostichus eleginoides]